MPMSEGSSSLLSSEQGAPHARPLAETPAGNHPAEHDMVAHAPAAATPRRGRVHAALSTLRPRQWIKNVLVIAAPGAAGALSHDDVPLRVGLTCVAFCLLASGIYAINDVRDAEEDRQHPRKRHRAVAAGEITPRAAVGLGVALMLGGLALCAAV